MLFTVRYTFVRCDGDPGVPCVVATSSLMAAEDAVETLNENPKARDVKMIVAEKEEQGCERS